MTPRVTDRRSYRGLAFGAGLALLAGCADTNTVDDGGLVDYAGIGEAGLEGLKAIKVTPADATLTIENDQPVKQVYRAIGAFTDGSVRDVTAATTFDLDDTYVGLFTDGNTFVTASDRGGKTTIRAKTTTGVTGSTGVLVVYKKVFLGSGISSGVEKSFDSATSDSSRAPTIAYPPDGVLVPPNLVELEFQWSPGSGNTIFELALKQTGLDIRLYTKCQTVGTGCGLVPSSAAWKSITGALKGQSAASVTVRGSDSQLKTVGESSAVSFLVAEEAIKGGLYYWNATPGTIVRYDFGKAGQKGTTFYTAKDAKALFCVGCHALSADGKRMAVGLDMPAPAPVRVIDVSTRTQISSGAANFMGFSPDGKKIITSDGNSMILRDVSTMTAQSPNPLVKKGTMPDFSPDGTKVIYAEPGTTVPFSIGTPGIEKGSLKMIVNNATTGAWSGSVTLVASAGENNYYPTWSPDGNYVIFNRSSSSSSYDAQDASLYIVRADFKSKPFELKIANGGTNLTNSWPKFSPFIQKYRSGKLMWVTFSSRRDYGLRIAGEGTAQIWMAAIDTGKGEMTTDQSHPAFWLPFQDSSTGNHIAQWVAEVVKNPCGIEGDCPDGQTCVKGYCE
jgi:hypothetical protein